MKKKKSTNKTAKEAPYNKALAKLYKFIDDSRTFEEFKYKLQGSKWWVFGEPMTQEFRNWTWREFQELFNKRKGIS